MRKCPTCKACFDAPLQFCPLDGRPLEEELPLLGQVLGGQFLVQELAGEGASAQVYRGQQLGVERPVAIKVLSPEVARSREYVERFRREAQATARLKSPGIISVYAVGNTDTGLPYMVMEWIEGRSLEDELDRKRCSASIMSVDRCLDLIEQVLVALDSAHRAGVVHRDLKPGNIMLSSRDGGEHLTLVDFGLAKILEADEEQGAGAQPLTRCGAIYGTPGYMSPEQAMGLDIDARSDLYALGVLIFELLTGRLPFEESGVALLVSHMHEPPPSLAALAPHLPRELDGLVQELLAKEPSERPQAAAQVLERLREIRVGREAMGAARTLMASLNELGERGELVVESSQGERPHSAAESYGEGELYVPGRRSARRSLALGLMALLVIALGSGSSALVSSAASGANRVGAAPLVTEPLASMDQRPGPSMRPGAKRALMLAAEGYSIRVLVPEEMVEERPEHIAIDVWGPDGHPLDDEELILVFVDAEGREHGGSAKAGSVPGRYEIEREFSGEGRHAMRVLPSEADMDLRLHFDISAESKPNS